MKLRKASVLSLLLLGTLLIVGFQVGAQGADSASPKYGGVLHTMFCCDTSHWDPHRGMYNTEFVSLVYSTLLRFPTGPDVGVDEFILEPGLAESWEQPDPTTYIFHLRQGVKFHDIPPVNGRELTADDVVFSIGRMLSDDPENTNRSMFEAIEDAVALDSHTVKITLNSPSAPLLSYLGTTFASIVPRADIDFKHVAIGTGPFMLASDERGTKVVYERNPNYYEEGLPYLDGYVIHINPDFASRMAAFRGRQIDLIQAVEYVQARPMLNADHSLGYAKYPASYGVLALLNLRKPPLDNEKVRQALSLAMDRESIARAQGGGEGVVNGPVPAFLGDWMAPTDELFGYTRDVERAKQLLAEAGYPDGFTLTAVGTNIFNRQILLESLSGQWADIGVTLNFQLLPSAEVGRIRLSRDWQILADNFAPAVDPDAYLYTPFHSKSIGNLGQYEDAELDQLLAAQRASTDEAERRQLVLEAQRRIAERSFVLFSGDPVLVSLWQPHVKGFNPTHVNPFLPLRTVWLDK